MRETGEEMKVRGNAREREMILRERERDKVRVSCHINIR